MESSLGSFLSFIKCQRGQVIRCLVSKLVCARNQEQRDLEQFVVSIQKMGVGRLSQVVEGSGREVKGEFSPLAIYAMLRFVNYLKTHLYAPIGGCLFYYQQMFVAPFSRREDVWAIMV